MYLFEGRTKKSVIYSYTGRTLREAEQHTLGRYVVQKAPSQTDNPDKIDLEMLNSACTRINTRTLTKLQKAGRFIPEVSHFRSDFHSVMQQFVAGEFQLFLLTGDNGVGKTNYLSQLVNRTQNISLFYSANEFRNTELGSKILRDMGFRSMFLEDFLANANEHFKSQNAIFSLLMPSVHFQGLCQIDWGLNSREQTEDYPWFRSFHTKYFI